MYSLYFITVLNHPRITFQTKNPMFYGAGDGATFLYIPWASFYFRYNDGSNYGAIVINSERNYVCPVLYRSCLFHARFNSAGD